MEIDLQIPKEIRRLKAIRKPMDFVRERQTVKLMDFEMDL